MRWPILIMLMLLITACGQKGDLTLPEKPDQQKSDQKKSEQQKAEQVQSAREQIILIFS